MNAIVAREEDWLKLTLKAAVIYDDFDFAARTAALLERAAVRSDEAIRWDIKPWRLDLLKPSSLADAALEEIINADLIVVALCKTHLPPDALLEWLERWARRRQTRDAALMVLCPEEAAGPMSCWARLKEFAEWQGLPFLGNRNLQDEGDSMNFVHRLWRRKQPVVPELPWSADRLQAPRHWGINE
ncbi:MAG: hypothetical protein ACLQAH_06265 [Limisphaerales bacterium]